MSRALKVAIQARQGGHLEVIALPSSLIKLLLLCCLLTNIAHAAESPAFDLTGPNIDIKVTRAGKTLPISEVPNLAEGDRLWIHPDLPDNQSAHYLLIVAFLRGSTNPPPEAWFIKSETWRKPTQDEGTYVVVPAGAQQALVFLAPQTGGDFATLRNAVRGRPGAFVRASQDLNQASLDRGRLDTYLAAVKESNETSPKDLQARSALLARSLNIRLDQQCFDKPTGEQAPCLVKNTGDLVLDDGHSQSVVANLTSGNSADLLAQASYSQSAGGGAYSAYVGAVVDMARILDSLHTAEYQYIPALGVARKGALELKLNIPPSFHKPMSVLVVGLPAVEPSQPPPLRAFGPNQRQCLEKVPLTLPADGSPLAFSTDFAHGMFLRVPAADGKSIDIPAKADAASGGFVLDPSGLKPGLLNTASSVTGTLHGRWGFDPYEGPTFKLQSARSVKWSLAESDRRSVIVGRRDTVYFDSVQAVCVEDVAVATADGRKLDATWKLSRPDQIAVELPLVDATPGDLKFEFRQAGEPKPDEAIVSTYSEAGHIDGFTIYAGDKQGMLKGSDLGDVASLDVRGIRFTPDTQSEGQTQTGDKNSLPLAATDDKAIAALHPNDQVTAKATLRDGRTVDVPASVQPGRPRVSLLNKSVQPSAAATNIKLADDTELPIDAQLTFAVHSESPPAFARNEKVEVASADGSFHVVLGVSDNTLVLQDAKTALITLDPGKAFGGSAFGPLQFRPVDGNGVAGDWQPLVTLVRLPQLNGIRCPPAKADDPGQPCTLDGASLFLLDSVALDAEFTNPTTVPEGFATPTLSLPRPTGPALYIKLRDDPSVVNTATLPVQQHR